LRSNGKQSTVAIDRKVLTGQVLATLYGNTHTNTSITGSQSTAFVAEARQLVAEAVNAKTTGKASLDLVLFA
jgi:selenocysteine lyase/cysteine desulfurase